jgi:hypothetical protein
MNFPPGPPRGWAPPSPEEVLAMSLTDKHRVLDWLDSWDCTHGTHYLADYEAARDRCPYVDPDSGRRCTERKHFDLSMCLTHVPLDELDPKGASRRHRAAAKLRMEELLDAGITRLEEIIQAPAEAVAPSVRLQALQLPFRPGRAAQGAVCCRRCPGRGLRRRIGRRADPDPDGEFARGGGARRATWDSTRHRRGRAEDLGRPGAGLMSEPQLRLVSPPPADANPTSAPALLAALICPRCPPRSRWPWTRSAPPSPPSGPGSAASS